jgi:hypothetical protein
MDSKGNWVAQEQSGMRGGLFVDRARALKFAKSECGPGSHAILWVSGVLELDLSAAPTAASEQRFAESVTDKRRADFSWLTRSAELVRSSAKPNPTPDCIKMVIRAARPPQVTASVRHAYTASWPSRPRQSGAKAQKSELSTGECQNLNTEKRHEAF